MPQYFLDVSLNLHDMSCTYNILIQWESQNDYPAIIGTERTMHKCCPLEDEKEDDGKTSCWCSRLSHTQPLEMKVQKDKIKLNGKANKNQFWEEITQLGAH